MNSALDGGSAAGSKFRLLWFLLREICDIFNALTSFNNEYYIEFIYNLSGSIAVLFCLAPWIDFDFEIVMGRVPR